MLPLLLAILAANPIVIDRATTPDPLYAIGDIHGDSARLTKLLEAAHLVRENHWTGNNATLVITGDMIDKGPDSVAVLHLLADLQKQSNGHIILLSGNHEAEFLADPHAKKTADFVRDLKRANYNPDEVAACKTDLGELLCGLPYAARLGDWFFSHAGNSGGRTVAQLKAELKPPQLLDPNSILEARLGEGKQQWIASEDERKLLDTYARALGVRHIVQGHQNNEIVFNDGTKRAKAEMFQRWGLLFLIDTGMSSEIDESTGAILRITKDTATAVCSNGRETLLWTKSLDIGRAAPCR